MSCAPVVLHSDGTEEAFDVSKLCIVPPDSFLRALPTKLCAKDIPDMLANSVEDTLVAGNIIARHLQNNCPSSFSSAMIGMESGILSSVFLEKVSKHKVVLDAAIVRDRDLNYDLYALRLLQKSYLLPLETPQYMNMRVSVFLNDDVDGMLSTYDAISRGLYTHASPTIFFSGTVTPQLASCFLMPVESDSIDGIYNTIKRTALISKNAGGIGINICNVRPRGSNIAKTGTSSGVLPMLRVFNETANYVDQCLVPETFVYTSEGPKQIQSLVSGVDYCVHDKSRDLVLNVLEHPYDGPLLKLFTMHSLEPLCVTPDHPLFVLRDLGPSYNYAYLKRKLSCSTNEYFADWVSAKEVRERDFVVFPIPTYECDVSTIDASDCYFYGVVLGDGYLEQHRTYGHITMHAVKKSGIKDWLINYFTSRCIHYSVSEYENTCRIRWTKSVSLPFKYADVYDSFGEKRVHHKWLNLPLSKMSFIVKGLMDTDGCIGKEFCFDSTSRNLIESMRYMLLRMGSLSSGYIRDRVGQSHVTKRGRITNRKISYTLRVPKTSFMCDLLNVSFSGGFTKFFRHGDFLYGRVQKKEVTFYKGTVYDLQMDKIHRYVTHNGLVHNGGGRRKGSFAMYIEPWHPDIFEFLDLRLNQGNEQHRCKDLFTALWVPDIFFEAVKNDSDWKLIDPRTIDLEHCHGDLFNRNYAAAVPVRVVKARDIWNRILRSQIETGTPYMLSKDATNKSNMQKHMGTITHSNLCAEIVQYSRPTETAVCVLASIALPKFVDSVKKTFDFSALEKLSMLVCKNLNHVLDGNYYPTDRSRRSALETRAIGIGQQGFSDVLQMMEIPYESVEAVSLSADIQKSIYYGALRMSCDLAKEHGPYPRFYNSPYSLGVLHCDYFDDDLMTSSKWMSLRMDIKSHGVRNSLLCANMPTASSSAILGNTESFEPRTSNFFVRRVLSGEFIVLNRILKSKIDDEKTWVHVLNWLKTHDGSVQGCPHVSAYYQKIFKTVYEIKMKWHIDHAAARQPWLDQSQSMNLWLPEANTGKLTSSLMYAWKKGLKTLSYYTRVKPKNKLSEIAPAVCVSCSS